jgi:putative membrane protein
MRVRQWSALAAVVLMTACAGDTDSDDQAAADSLNAAPPPAPAPPPLGDAEIAHIVWTANSADIESGEAAKGKATDAEVKGFAQQMIDDHTASNNAVQALATKLGVTPAENAASTSMKADHERVKAELAAKTGADYDRAYIANEVTMHQAVLNAIDQQLLPAVQNAELRALIDKTRPVIEGHLQRAQAIQTKLGTGPT